MVSDGVIIVIITYPIVVITYPVVVILNLIQYLAASITIGAVGEVRS